MNYNSLDALLTYKPSADIECLIGVTAMPSLKPDDYASLLEYLEGTRVRAKFLVVLVSTTGQDETLSSVIVESLNLFVLKVGTSVDGKLNCHSV